MKNMFGRLIPSNREILADAATRTYVRRTLEGTLSSLGHPAPAGAGADLLSLARDLPREEFERAAHAYLQDLAPWKTLVGRAEQELQQIRPYVAGNQVLDFGCGDGKVGRLLAKEGYGVTLVDVYRHPEIDERTEFALLPETGRAPIEREYDTTLLLTVLHHCKDPPGALAEAVRCTREGGRVIAIESVYGVSGGPLAVLDADRQWDVAFFFDRFYNNAITDPSLDVHTPGNYRTPDGWSEAFAAQGLKEVERKDLGIDLVIVPEHHMLYVLEKS